MKFLNSIFAVFFVATLALSLNSCSNDDEITADPVDVIVTIDGTPSKQPGTNVKFNITVTSGSLMDKVVISPVENGVVLSGQDVTIGLGGVSGAVDTSFTYSIANDAVVGKVVKFQFAAYDEVGEAKVEAEFTVTAPPAPIVAIFSNVIIEASTSGGSLNSNCASIDGTVYSYEAAKLSTALQAKTDFVMVPGATADVSKLVAPASVSSVINGGLDGWTTKNATKFFATTISQADYDAVTVNSDAKITALATGTEVTDVVAATGTIFAFQTAGGLKGFAKMVNYEPDGKAGQADWNDALLTLEIKVQIATPNAK